MLQSMLSDSVILQVKSKHSYEELLKKLDDTGVMDLSNLDPSHPLFSEKNKHSPGYMKTECCLKERYTEIISLAPKLYAIKSETLDTPTTETKETFRAKGEQKLCEIKTIHKNITKKIPGTPRNVVNRSFTFNSFKDALIETKDVYSEFQRIAMKNFTIRTESVKRISLTSADVKR